MSNFIYVDRSKKLLSSDSPEGMEVQVMNALQNGYDLSEPPCVIGGELCQWITLRESVFQYVLVTASKPSIFEMVVKEKNAQGYELALQPVSWNGLTCQWMAKVKEVGSNETVRVTYAGILPEILGVGFSYFLPRLK